MAKRLADLKLIDRHTLRTLQTHTSICPRIYGQPKAHKPNLPLRPVVPNITAPTYHLSKFISCILQKSFSSKYNIRDSFTFSTYINSTTLPPDHVMVSFDVVSLFTNIPKEFVIRSIMFRWKDIKQETNINLDLFLEMTELCINNSYFQFRGKYYKQISGTAMGSPLSPILADYVMEDLLDVVTKRLNFNIPVLKKYVDDLFMVLPIAEVQNTLMTFNQYDPNLQFTVEMENDRALPFLDTLVTRNNDQTMTTRWYSKPISSGRLLNFLSFHPTSTKINVANNFIHRVTLLSTNTTPEQQKATIFQHLRQNNYPSSLINRLTHHIQRHSTPNGHPHHPTLSAQHPPPTQSTSTSTNHHNSAPSVEEIIPQEQSHQNLIEYKYRSLANIPILTQSISAIRKKDYTNVKIAPRTIKTTRSLLQPVKDPVSPQQQHNIIYSIPCRNCELVYIGMTTNQLKKRLSGHKSNINKLNEILPTTEHIHAKTALIQHMVDRQHIFNLDDTKIVDRTFRSSALPMLEMCHITNTPNTVNYRTDVEGLNATYAGILHTVKNNLSRREQLRNNTLNRDTQSTIATQESI